MMPWRKILSIPGQGDSASALFHEKAPKWRGLFLLLSAIGILLIISGSSLRIPNPPAILLTMVIYSAFVGGTARGLISALIAWVYIAYFFSRPGEPFHYDAENFRRVIVWALSIPLMTWMVGKLRDREASAKDATLRLIADSLPALISYVDREERYRFNNSAYEKWFGRPFDHFRGKTLKESLGDKAYQSIKPHFDEAIRGKAQTFETLVRYKDGGDRFVRANYVPDFAPSGTVRGVVILVEDLTAQAQVAEQLRNRMAELARANDELARFAHVASHDLKEPLRMISAYAQLLAREYQGILTPRAEEYIHQLTAGTKRMYRLIDDLLSLARIGITKESLQTVYPAECVKAALLNLHFAINEARATVKVGPLPQALANPGLLIQLFQNLIGNAVKYRKESEPLQVEIYGVLKGNEVEFSVSDNGIGIDPKFFERVFVIFQRLQPAADTSGTGVGLAICKKIVECHGGKIWVDSLPGRGSLFHFTLPASLGLAASSEQ